MRFQLLRNTSRAHFCIDLRAALLVNADLKSTLFGVVDYFFARKCDRIDACFQSQYISLGSVFSLRSHAT